MDTTTRNTTRNTTRKPGAERREETARAVLRILGAKGITSLTTGALAAEVGLTSGALFRHFPSRDAMLEGAVDYALARMEATFPDQALDPLTRIVQLAENRVAVLGTDAGIAWLFRSDQANLCLPPAAVRKLGDMARRSKRFVLEALQEGMAQGTVRDDIDPKVLLVPVMGTIHALVGMPGIHETVVRTDTVGTTQVMTAMKSLLAPPGMPADLNHRAPAGAGE